jgi:ribosomal protein S13
MALTNLAGVGEHVRKRILKEDGFPNIEQYMYEDHQMLRRAATECMCNLVVQEEVSVNRQLQLEFRSSLGSEIIHG